MMFIAAKPVKTPPRISRAVLIALAMAAVALAASPVVTAQDRGNITIERLIGDDVSDFGGSQYAEVGQAITFFGNSDFANARTLLEIAKKKNDLLPPANVLVARLFLMINQIEQAYAALTRATKDTPDDPEPYLIFGDVAVRQGQVSNARLNLKEADRLCKKYSRNLGRKRKLQRRVYAGLATVAEAYEDWSAAETHLQSWLELDGDNTSAMTRMGRVIFRQDGPNKGSEATKMFTKAYAVDNNVTPPYVATALLYEADGKHKTAVKVMARAVTDKPDDLRTRLLVAQWAIDSGEVDLAKTNAAAALALDGDSLPAKVIAGRTARFNKDYDAAEQVLKSAFLQSPTNFRAINELALVLVKQQDEASRISATQYAQLNVRLHNDAKQTVSHEAAVTLAWVLHRRELEADATRLIEAVFQGGRRVSVSAESGYFAARVLAGRGRTEIARGILEGVLEKETPFPNRADALEFLEGLPVEATDEEK